MGSLSDEEIKREEEFLNPLTNQVSNVMSNVIKQKVRSALCDEDKVDAFNKGKIGGFITKLWPSKLAKNKEKIKNK